MADKNPDNLKELNAVKITSETKDFVTRLSSDISEAKAERATWDQNIDRYVNMRYGVRANKNHPWPNCANYVIPQIDADINRVKPTYVNLVNVTPVVTFEPYGPEDIEPARKREYLYDWRLKTQMDFFEPYILGVDYLLMQGAVVYKVTWDYRTRTYNKYLSLADLDDEVIQAIYDPAVTDEILEQILVEAFLVDTTFDENVDEVRRVVKEFREGKSEFEMVLTEEAANEPKLTACSIRDDLVFPVDTMDLNEARFIDYLFDVSENDLKIAMKDGKYEKFMDSEIESWNNIAPEDSRRFSKFRSMKRTGEETDRIWLHETCVWYDINNDGIEERCIVTWPDADPSAVLRFIELPYDHGEWPYVLVKREIVDPGALSSRGYGALDEDFQNGISTFFNQSVDNGTITNTPILKHRRNSLQNIRNLRYIPGQSLEVNGQLSDVEVQQLGNNSQVYLLQSAQYLKSWADQRTGNVTAGLSSPNNLLGGGQQGNKTKKEIDVIESLQGQASSLDLQVFQMQMARVHYQIDALYEQFGSEEEEFLITGERPVRVSRQEIQGKYNIVPNGRIDNSNPVMRANRSFMILRAFMGDPDIKQRELKKMFLDDLDIKLTKKLFKSDEEIQMEQQMMMQTQQSVKGEMLNDQMMIRQANDDFDIRKEAILSQIQGRKYAPN